MLATASSAPQQGGEFWHPPMGLSTDSVDFTTGMNALTQCLIYTFYENIGARKNYLTQGLDFHVAPQHSLRRAGSWILHHPRADVAKPAKHPIQARLRSSDRSSCIHSYFAAHLEPPVPRHRLPCRHH